MPLKKKGHDQPLPWHLGREGLIYSIQVQELALLAKRRLSPQLHGIRIDGVQPVFPAVQFLIYSRVWQQMWLLSATFFPCLVCC